MVPPRALSERLNKAGQAHLLTFWDELNENQQKALVADIESADIERMNEIYRQSLTNNTHSQGYEFTPPTIITWKDPETSSATGNDVCVLTRLNDVSKNIADAWHKRGLQLICQGKLAAVIMAGGQGTRLGWDGPKGTYPIGPISNKSLFQIFCERYTSVRRLAQGSLSTLPSVPFYVMTSDQNHNVTIEFFKQNHYFGLSENDVIFFQQKTVPCYSNEGKILLEEKWKLARNPNGNGGIFESLRGAGMIDDMKNRGVQGIHVFGIDNALVKVLDPTFIGYVDASRSPVGNKCVVKTNPDEKVGLMCKRRPTTAIDSKSEVPAVVEYSDLPVEMQNKRVSNDPKSPLIFSAANIVNHFFRIDFIEKLLESKINQTVFFPHVAHKKIQCVDPSTGHNISPTTNNGIKFEYFIFDSFFIANRVAGLEVTRESDFSPVKNAEGDDSPATCRDLMSKLYKSWLQKSGVMIRGEGFLEISPLISYEGENLSNIKVVELPTYLKP